MKHYIGMNGSYGCLPDSCDVYESHEDAVQSLADLLELTDDQITELRTGHTDCTHEQGAAYASVDECICQHPWEHSNSVTSEKQFRRDYPDMCEGLGLDEGEDQ
jgi:hypothetical protein